MIKSRINYIFRNIIQWLPAILVSVCFSLFNWDSGEAIFYIIGISIFFGAMLQVFFSIFFIGISNTVCSWLGEEKIIHADDVLRYNTISAVLLATIMFLVGIAFQAQKIVLIKECLDQNKYEQYYYSEPSEFVEFCVNAVS